MIIVLLQTCSPLPPPPPPNTQLPKALRHCRATELRVVRNEIPEILYTRHKASPWQDAQAESWENCEIKFLSLRGHLVMPIQSSLNLLEQLYWTRVTELWTIFNSAQRHEYLFNFPNNALLVAYYSSSRNDIQYCTSVCKVAGLVILQDY